MNSPVPFDEVARLEALNRYDLDDLDHNPIFEDLLTLATSACRVPVAHIAFLGRDKLYIKASVGLDPRAVPRRASYSAYAICKRTDVLIVPDTRDDWRFTQNPMIALDPRIRFFAAAPLCEPSGYPIGTLVVMDYQPRSLSDDEQLIMRKLARLAIVLLDSRQEIRRLEGELLERRAYEARVADLQQHLLAANSELGAASLTDCLTQIGNRRAFEQHIADEITRANRINYTLALLMIDIDHFKHFNDEFGHPMGDQIIRLVAHCITHTVRATDFAARLGGDEFVVILPGTDLLGARIIAERVRLKIEQLAYPMHPVHVSVGIGRLATGRADASSLMADADRSLRRAKESGRNRVVGSVEPDTALGHDSQVNVSNKLSG